jgi:hypothetical protein
MTHGEHRSRQVGRCISMHCCSSGELRTQTRALYHNIVEKALYDRRACLLALLMRRVQKQWDEDRVVNAIANNNNGA